MVNETWPQNPSDKVKHIYDWLTEKERQEMFSLLQENGKTNTADLWESNVENTEIPQGLKDYRKAWKDKIRCLSDNTKEKIAKVAENIPVKVETDSDGSRLIEFKLWNKTRKILVPKLETNTDEKYFDSEEWEFITKRDERVQLWWMMWNDVSKWKNEKLKDYVQQKQKEWLHIPSQDEMKILLENLGNQADLDDIEDEIAMLMYLTGMDWYYWLSMRDWILRSGLECRRDVTYFYTSSRTIDDPASLCMIACE